VSNGCKCEYTKLQIYVTQENIISTGREVVELLVPEAVTISEAYEKTQGAIDDVNKVYGDEDTAFYAYIDREGVYVRCEFPGSDIPPLDHQIARRI
jgi:hypothetical protein